MAALMLAASLALAGCSGSRDGGGSRATDAPAATDAPTAAPTVDRAKMLEWWGALDDAWRSDSSLAQDAFTGQVPERSDQADSLDSAALNLQAHLDAFDGSSPDGTDDVRQAMDAGVRAYLGSLRSLKTALYAAGGPPSDGLASVTNPTSGMRQALDLARATYQASGGNADDLKL